VPSKSESSWDSTLKSIEWSLLSSTSCSVWNSLSCSSVSVCSLMVDKACRSYICYIYSANSISSCSLNDASYSAYAMASNFLSYSRASISEMCLAYSSSSSSSYNFWRCEIFWISSNWVVSSILDVYHSYGSMVISDDDD